MFEATNTQLAKVFYRGGVTEGGTPQRTSGRGEPDGTGVKVLSTLLPYNLLRTWTNFSLARKQELKADGVEVQGVWECSQALQRLLGNTAGCRQLRIGDHVQFSTRPEWFKLGQYEDEAGLFGEEAALIKWNLLPSDRRPGT